jgi:hypothetical protein
MLYSSNVDLKKARCLFNIVREAIKPKAVSERRAITNTIPKCPPQVEN